MRGNKKGKVKDEKRIGRKMTYQHQLAIEFMSKLSVSVVIYQCMQAEYSDHWIDSMNGEFDKTYEEIYGYLPHGC